MIQVMVAMAFTGMVFFSIGITACYVITRKDLKALEESVIRDRQANYRAATLLAHGIELINADLENIDHNNNFQRNIQVSNTKIFLDRIEKEFSWEE